MRREIAQVVDVDAMYRIRMLVVRNVLMGLAAILLAVFGDLVINSWSSYRERQSVRLICEVHVVYVGNEDV